MLTMLNILLMLTLLYLIIIILSTSISMKSKWLRDKPSPFECGFNPKTSSRLPFSLRFFLIAMVFLIFDAEITLLLPMPLILYTTDLNLFILTLTILIWTLLFGLLYEWKQGILKWAA